MADVTPKEISHWKDQLEDRAFLARLGNFQNTIFRTCDQYRQQVGMGVIRAVVPRDDIKSLDSVVDKIIRSRRTNQAYKFENIEDLIGVKILCPYLSSVRIVAKWLWKQKKEFTIKPLTLKEALTTHKTGYRGYHFKAVPNVGPHPDWVGLLCEIQVKTMCQETWDAQTHETSYRREELIDPQLVAHMRQLSNVLTAVDKQGEIIKEQIERAEVEDLERRDAAAAVLFWESLGLIQEFKGRYRTNLSTADPRQWTDSDLQTLNSNVASYRGDVGTTIPLCEFAALLALRKKDPEQQAMALSLSSEYLNRNQSDPKALDTMATVCWAFNRLSEAVTYGEEAVSKGNTTPPHDSIEEFKGNLCYWVADAVRVGKRVREDLKQQILSHSTELAQAYPLDPGYLDSAGFVKIVLGRSAADVEKGLKLVRRAIVLGSKSQDEQIRRLSKTFGRRHERLGFLRLAELYRKRRARRIL